MSYTHTYIVSTTRKYINRMAIVSSGNCRGALMKFLIHIHPSYDPEKIKLLARSTQVHNHATYYEVTDDNGKFNVCVRKINIKDDFIPINDYCHSEDYKTE